MRKPLDKLSPILVIVVPAAGTAAVHTVILFLDSLVMTIGTARRRAHAAVTDHMPGNTADDRARYAASRSRQRAEKSERVARKAFLEHVPQKCRRFCDRRHRIYPMSLEGHAPTYWIGASSFAKFDSEFGKHALAELSFLFPAPQRAFRNLEMHRVFSRETDAPIPASSIEIAR